MFTASIVFCAFVEGQPDFDRCEYFVDTLGPYTTIEECATRANVMQLQMRMNPIAMFYILENLGNPEDWRSRGMCENEGVTT